MTPTAAADLYRKAAAAERDIAYRIGRLQAGTTRATDYALAKHAGRKADAVDALLAAGARETVGLLVEEDHLADRLRQARADDQERPELVERIINVRRQIRGSAA